MISVLVVTSYYNRLMIIIMNALGRNLISVIVLTKHVNYNIIMLVVCYSDFTLLVCTFLQAKAVFVWDMAYGIDYKRSCEPDSSLRTGPV